MEQTPDIGVLAGAFPLIHPGYVKLFKELNDACVTPFILLHDDPSIERPEKQKPILSLEERMDMVRPFFLYDQVQFLVYNTEA